MKKIRNIIFISLMFLGVICLNNVVYGASDFDLDEINFYAVLNEDGSMDVTETWYIHVNDTTNTLYKTFKLDNSRYGGIINPKVSQVINEKEEDFKQINEEKYHVDKKCYYGLVNQKGDYEIAWGINENRGDKVYKISYKVLDCVKLYEDCAELYWQFIGDQFEKNVDKIEGEIIIPEGVVDKDDVRVWGHGPYNGTIQLENEKRVIFKVNDLPKNTILEIRLAMPTILFGNIANIIDESRLSTILEEETIWAEEANLKREEELKKQKIMKNCSIIVASIFAIALLGRAIKYAIILKSTKKVVPTEEYKYYRELPNEVDTPAEAAFLYYFNNGGMSNQLSKILSATMLDLCMKKIIQFEFSDSKKKDIVVKINENATTENLKEDEVIIYNLLNKIKNKETSSFTMKDFEKYARKHNESFLKELEEITKAAEKVANQQRWYNKDVKKESDSWNIRGIIILILCAVFSFAPVFGASLLVIPIIRNFGNNNQYNMFYDCS